MVMIDTIMVSDPRLIISLAIILVAGGAALFWALFSRRQKKKKQTAKANREKGTLPQVIVTSFKNEKRLKTVALANKAQEEELFKSIRSKTQNYVPGCDLSDKYIVEDSDDDAAESNHEKVH